MHGFSVNGNLPPASPEAMDGVEKCPRLCEGCWEVPCRRVHRLHTWGVKLDLQEGGDARGIQPLGAMRG